MQTIAARPEYWPLGHTMQSGSLGFGWKVPMPQGWQLTEATSLQNVGSVVFASSAVWNSVSPKSVSQYQILLDVEVVTLLLNPGEQPPWHWVSSVVLPPLQPTLTCSAGQRASQTSQLAWPVVFWYLPPGHNVQREPPKEKDPAAQIAVHPASSDICATRSLLLPDRPDGQDVQEATATPCVLLVLNFPAGQSAHTPADANLPGTQLEQTASENDVALSAVSASPAAQGAHVPVAPILSTLLLSRGMPMMMPVSVTTPPTHK